MNKLLKDNFFTIITKLLIIILPFYVIIKVYLDKKLWLWFLGFFIKEFLIVLLFLSFVFSKVKNKEKIKFDTLDYLIILFILYWIIISFVNWLWLKEIIIWWRYDFLWFVVFFIFKHSKNLLTEKRKNLLYLFLMSAWISIFLGIIVKFITWEEILQLFGYSIYVADFDFKWWIPIYQWVEASWIRRFQGILDSPLAMWYLLIIYMWVFSYLNKKNLDFAYFLWFLLLASLLFLTYSRAAMLWVIIAIFLVFITYSKKIFKILKKHKKASISVISWIIIFIMALGYTFQDKIHNVFIRDGSTSWHFSRMMIWIDRFVEKPLWQWLSSSGPAYRYFVKETSLKTDNFYIPESWFIQILVEWWIIYFILYLLIILAILQNLYKNKYYYIFATYIAILTMSFFLHIFEYTYLTILLYMILWLFYTNKKNAF